MANMVVRLDNVQATHDGSLLKSAKYFNSSDKKTEVQNGVLVTIGELLTGEREIHKATDVASGDTYIGIVCTPELIYDQTGLGDTVLENFTNAADEVIRVAILERGDIFSIANEAAAGADKTVGDLTAKFMGTEKSGRYTYNVYEVQ